VHIGLLAPPWIPTPPPAYGGIERVVALQAAGMAAAGHEVTLVAAPGSSVPGVRVVSPLERLPSQIGLATDEWRHVLGGLDELAGVDMIFDHSGPLGALLSAQALVPSIHVVHGSLETELLGLYDGLFARAPQLRLAAISKSQRGAAPHLPFVGICHNAIDIALAPFRRQSDGYLAFLGRMAPEKGIEAAIVLARESGLPLMIAAKCRERAEHEYFEKAVAPHLGPDVVFLGELDSRATYEFLSRALALLFPICWREPFGMVLIEAMACGTPVLATNRGAVGEIVVDGVTGFVRDAAAELGPLIARIGEIDRMACRRHVAEHFSTDALVRGYTRMLPPRRQPRRSVGAASPMVFRSPASPSTPRSDPHTPAIAHRSAPVGTTRPRAAR
jgi:glycosyltransferase involved in cell wall biosynthesis